MRGCTIFSGSSHPWLVASMCDRLGQKPAHVDLKKFSNGETSVEIKTSVRDKDVFIVQSGSEQINDDLMEMLIMINAAKGGSARSITAVMPYFAYSRQSKRKAHRGAIVARMVANLMKVAGVDHVITIDLHATQMQGFFKCPIDNLTAEPLLTRWVAQNVKNWENSVVVSKNPGGTKRATSLADRLNLSFGIVTTDQKHRKPKYSASMVNSVILACDGSNENGSGPASEDNPDTHYVGRESQSPRQPTQHINGLTNGHGRPHHLPNQHRGITSDPTTAARRGHTNGNEIPPSPLAQASLPGSANGEQQTGDASAYSTGVSRASAAPRQDGDGYEDPDDPDNDSDEAVRDVISGVLHNGHIVDDATPSSDEESPPPSMMQSFVSTTSAGHWPRGEGLGGTGDANHSDEEEEDNFQNPDIETRVTLVGNVRNNPVIIVDDMIDKAGSWIAAAETVVKRGGATKVYCMATHGLFGGDSLRQLDECSEIEAVIVTNSFPIPEAKRNTTRKLIVLDVSSLLAEAMRRNHNGESISNLYSMLD